MVYGQIVNLPNGNKYICQNDIFSIMPKYIRITLDEDIEKILLEKYSEYLMTNKQFVRFNKFIKDILTECLKTKIQIAEMPNDKKTIEQKPIDKMSKR